MTRPFAWGDDLRKRLAHFSLGGRERGVHRVGGVAHHKVDSDFAEARERAEVGMDAVDGRLVEFEVTGVEHVARRALQEQADGAGEWSGSRRRSRRSCSRA